MRPLPHNLNSGPMRSPGDVAGREQWATRLFLASPGLLGLRPDLLTWGFMTWEALLPRPEILGQ